MPTAAGRTLLARPMRPSWACASSSGPLQTLTGSACASSFSSPTTEPTTARLSRLPTSAPRWQSSGTRPGGNVLGPTLMALADTALFVAIHSSIGPTPQAVTASLNINVLRRPPLTRTSWLYANCWSVGRSLAVGEVSLFPEGTDDPVPRQSCWSLPLGASLGPSSPDCC